MTSPPARPRRPALLSRLSLRARVSLLVAVAVGLAVALTSCAAYFTVRHALHSERDETLIDRAQAVVRSRVDPAQIAKLPSGALGAGDVRIALVHDGRALVNSGGIPPLGQPELLVADGQTSMSIRTAARDGITFRVVAVPAESGESGESGEALVFAQPTAPTEHQLDQLGTVLLIVGGIGVVVAGSAGLSIARTGLRPVERLTAAAEHVARTEELRPIPVEPGRDDELARLAHSFNAMLGALAQSRQRQQQLVADAGHELKTPLTSLRTNLDLLAQSERAGDRGLDPQERAGLLADVRAQIEEMSGLVGDLVELARGDTPQEEYGQLDLAEVLDRALERVRRRALGLRFEVHAEPWQLYGDPHGLERAFTNLLDNAAKWSPRDGTVTVTLRDGVLQVADEGPGIAEADRAHVFDRFYRATDARTLPGSGLGLAIVRQVVEQHGGTVWVGRASTDGALFVVGFPGRHMPATTTSAQSFSNDSGSSQAHQ